MRRAIRYPIADIVPHAGKMSLLDRALEGDDASLLAEVTIRPDSLFFDGAGVGAWVGIEYMAQAIAAWAGWQSRQQGEAPKVGFLLGTRRYECNRAHFLLGETLQIEVHRQFQADNGLSQFECAICIQGEPVANAALTAFRPDNVEQFLQGGRHE
ncbi:hotdog family protein [Parachitinimonas caeni]|uniref:Hotdog family protein n=1 Tax=Parachitinimonas caeni TaxID=3031301 RepID=A0ABT7E0P9_9NEIS|nr:hotdog family protein [Parachitinimonas caeni]MDK2124913.1 hotdog family protein [Parachitinimonas caeni]